jgi:hypothetical protein
MEKWKLLCWLIRNLSGRERMTGRFTALRDEVQRTLDRFGDHWMTYTTRPKTPRSSIDVSSSATRIGVVIQGKIRTADDFTLRTVEHYHRTFANCPIFVSTWSNECTEAIRSLERAGAVVLINELPEFPSTCHLNYQVRSTLAGVQAACEFGCQFALKTRTDTRMYAANIGDFLAALVEQFPVASGYAAQGRLVVLDWATRMFIPQHPSDLMVFGYAKDMLNYWDVPCCTDPQSASLPIRDSFADMLNVLVPEVYLCRHYLQKLGYPFEPTVTSWWRCLADLFIVVDRSMLEHFWPKYNYTSEHCSGPDDQLRNEAVCSFRDWLGIMSFRKTPYFDVEDLLTQKPNALLSEAA